VRLGGRIAELAGVHGRANQLVVNAITRRAAQNASSARISM
jgi:hypothetical protein